MEVVIAYVVSGTVAASAVTPVDTVTHTAGSPEKTQGERTAKRERGGGCSVERAAGAFSLQFRRAAFPVFKVATLPFPLRSRTYCRTITFATLRSGSSLLLRSRIRCAGDAAGTRNAHPIVRSDRPPIAMQIPENI